MPIFYNPGAPPWKSYQDLAPILAEILQRSCDGIHVAIISYQDCIFPRKSLAKKARKLLPKTE